MRIIDDKNLVAELSYEELILIRNAMSFVHKSIEDWEFHARLGVQRDDFFKIIQRIEAISIPLQKDNGEKKQGTINSNNNNLKIKITNDEFLGMVNALNEVCNGIRVPEFYKSIGADKETVFHLLNQVGEEFDRIIEE